MKKEIVYLIRFFDEEYKVNYLFDKGLYMSPACSYHKTDKHTLKWDYSEAAISDCFAYKNSEKPIWCCTAVFKENIINNTIILDKKLLDDFSCKEGYAVIINVDRFLDAINTNPYNYYSYAYGVVKYTQRKAKEILLNNHFASSLFVKYPQFRHQQEFRFCIDYNCEKIFEKDVNNIFQLGTEQDVLKGHRPFEYQLKNIEMFSQKLLFKEFVKNGEIKIDLAILDKNIFN